MLDQDEIAHVPLFTVPGMLTASKRTSWRNYIMAIAEATANVFTDEKFTNTNLKKRFASNPGKFIVAVGDLTPEGFRFARAGRFDKWLGNADRWTTECTLQKLETALRQQIRKFRNSTS